MDPAAGYQAVGYQPLAGEESKRRDSGTNEEYIVIHVYPSNPQAAIQGIGAKVRDKRVSLGGFVDGKQGIYLSNYEAKPRLDALLEKRASSGGLLYGDRYFFAGIQPTYAATEFRMAGSSAAPRGSVNDDVVDRDATSRTESCWSKIFSCCRG